MKLWTKVKLIFGVVLAGGLALGGYYLGYKTARGGTIRRNVDAPAIVKEIQKLSELITVKYNIQKVVGLEEEKVPFGSEKVIMLVQATVLGGVDLAKLTTQQVTCASNSATIHLPAPKVMHVFINDKDTRVWDRTKTWWTPWVPFSPDLEQKARQAALEAMQAAALDMGILSNAQQNAETTIREFLHAAGVESVTFITN